MTSDAAVNAEEREIARTMDDEKQRDDSGIARPKEQRIERMIDRAEQKQDRGQEAAFPAAGGAEREQGEAARAMYEAEDHSPPH